jgi:hypothetical protein
MAKIKASVVTFLRVAFALAYLTFIEYDLSNIRASVEGRFGLTLVTARPRKAPQLHFL